MSTVEYSATFTRNLGNFESLKVSVGVSDSPRGDETTTQAFNRVKGFVEDKLIGEVTEMEKSISDARKAASE